MSILSELKTVAAELNIPVETGAYTSAAPDCFLVMTPIMDSLPLSADDKPVSEVNEVRLSLYSRDNYLQTATSLTKSLIRSDFVITDRRYVEYETETGYHHYAVDVAKEYEFKEDT